VTDSVIPGLAHCWEQLFDLSGGAQAVVDLEVPVVLWAGEEDAYYRPMLSFAQQITSTSYQGQAIMPVPRSMALFTSQRPSEEYF